MSKFSEFSSESGTLSSAIENNLIEGKVLPTISSTIYRGKANKFEKTGKTNYRFKTKTISNIMITFPIVSTIPQKIFVETLILIIDYKIQNMI